MSVLVTAIIAGALAFAAGTVITALVLLAIRLLTYEGPER